MSYRGHSRMGVNILRFEGDLNVSEMMKMKERLSRIINKNHRKVLLDLGSARHVDMVGLGILVDRLRKLRALRGDIKLFNMRPEVAETFQRVGAERLMESFGSEAEALQSFGVA